MPFLNNKANLLRSPSQNLYVLGNFLTNPFFDLVHLFPHSLHLQCNLSFLNPINSYFLLHSGHSFLLISDKLATCFDNLLLINL